VGEERLSEGGEWRDWQNFKCLAVAVVPLSQTYSF